MVFVDSTQRSDPSTRLVERFAFAAQSHLEAASDALDAQCEFDFEEAFALQLVALHIGISVEYLSLAVIAQFEPPRIWVKPPGADESGHTIKARPALKLACALAPSIHQPTAKVEDALEVRNSAAHRAEVADRAKLATLLNEARSFQRRVLRELPEVATAMRALDEARADVAAGRIRDAMDGEAVEKVLAAHAARQRRNNGLTSDQIALIDSILTSRPAGTTLDPRDEWYHVACPACEYPRAVVTASQQYDGLGLEFLVPAVLRCLQCDLCLDYDEAASVGIDVAPYFRGER